MTSYAGSYGSTLAEFEAACRVAQGLGTRILGGTLPLWTRDRAAALATLRRYELVLAIENHPGTLTPEEMLAAIGDGAEGTVGTAVDTGWYGTAEIDAVQAIQELGSHILHVHLKDVLAPGSHESCRYGRGCVPVEACVRALVSAGYRGPISVEHEPAAYDPSEDCTANLALLRTWVTP
jgi:sugar phosphate isomerase/epimerase